LQQEDPNWEVSYVVDAYHAGNVRWPCLHLSYTY
jgi:hypothetical protein